MRSSLPGDVVEALLNTEDAADVHAMMQMLGRLERPEHALVEARRVLQAATAEHSRSVYRLRYKEQMITDEALRLLELSATEETT